MKSALRALLDRILEKETMKTKNIPQFHLTVAII